mmetsp:Transcript_1518/g.3759  ORF Transcript_1518/g.3759 Transcript_1518/m.3759 type:complete len:495 (+) Transcript_1518:97-1581(+)
MSDEDDDLFADSGDDTDDLIAASQKAKPIAKPKKLKKKSLKKRKRAEVPDADNDSDDDGPGLFDSDDEGPSAAKKPAKPMSKRERMEALSKKKRDESHVGAPSDGQRRSRPEGGGDKESGYDSANSFDSAEYVRTKEDNDFIDTEGDDQDAINELYADQQFDDLGEAMEERQVKKKIRGVGSDRGRSERAELEAEGDPDNPIMQAVNRMKRKKRQAKKFSELEDEGKALIDKMEHAANLDDEAIAQKRPALKKLMLMTEVVEVMGRKEMFRILLDLDILAVCKRWIQPLKNGTLGNVTIRQRMVHAISLMHGEFGITSSDLKKSDFGKVVMSLYMHKSETPSMKRELKKLIEQWSRPIFQKSGNMRDLERVQHVRGGGGLSAFARQNRSQETAPTVAKSGHRGGQNQDLNSLIQSGLKGKNESGINRVRVPYSKGFQYSVRPTNRTSGDVDKRRATQASRDNRGNLSRRMLEKSRTVSKNQRSANISVEGRATK